MAHHNELCDEVADLAGNAFTSAHAHNNPKIFTGRTARGGSKLKAAGKVKVTPPTEEGGRRDTCLYRIFGIRGQTSFTTCVS